MNVRALLLAGAGALVGVGCVNTETITGSGHQVTRTVKVADFTSVQVHGAFQVDIERGDTFHTAITADDNLFDSIVVETDGATLKIGPAPGKNFQLGKNELKAAITMPRLEGISLAGASTGRFGGFKSSPELTIECMGASALSGRVDTAKLKVEAEGASEVKLQGTAKEAALSASGASLLHLSGLKANDASVTLSGASVAELDVKGNLDYTVSGASTLSYRGGARIGKSEESGASSVVRR